MPNTVGDLFRGPRRTRSEDFLDCQNNTGDRSVGRSVGTADRRCSGAAAQPGSEEAAPHARRADNAVSRKDVAQKTNTHTRARARMHTHTNQKKNIQRDKFHQRRMKARQTRHPHRWQISVASRLAGTQSCKRKQTRTLATPQA